MKTINRRFQNITLFFLLFTPVVVMSQENANSIEESIDARFEQWDSPDQPGIAMTILHKGKVIYKKAFGSANLEHNIPVTTNTKFQIAGMSKHFTAFAILLLEEQGKLSLEDDVRKYLPEFPDFGKTITIRHLITLSSGLHGYWPLKSIAGWSQSDIFTNEQAMEMISRQKKLDFDPGTDFSYNNTEITLLAMIVSKASGKSFATFTKEHMFDPLNMSNTAFLEDYETLVDNVAISYQPDGDGFKKSDLNYGIAGPTNLYTSIEDMLLWERNLISPKIGSLDLIKKLNSPATLKNGKTFDPTYGRLTLGQQFINSERGLGELYQTGSLGGYSSAIFKFPTEKFVAIVMSNNGMGYNGYLAMLTAHSLLEDKFTEPVSIDFENMKTLKLSRKKLEKFEGNYWNPKSAYSRRIYLKDDTLRYFRGVDNESTIIPITNNTFQMMTRWDDVIIIKFENQNGKSLMKMTFGESDPLISERYEPINYSKEQLEAFTGTFLCEELNASYSFEARGEKLIAKNIRVSDTEFTAVRKDVFEGDKWFLGGIEFERDENQNIIGFRLFTDGVQNLRFKKVLLK